MRLKSLDILGTNYRIIYVNKAPVTYGAMVPRESFWGNVDYQTKTIRVYIYNNNDAEREIMQSLVHEVLHIVSKELKLSLGNMDKHDELDVIALAITDTFLKNNLVK